MKPEYTIGRALKTDIDACAEMLICLFSLERDFTPDRAAQRRGLLMLLESPLARVAVARQGGKVVGMITAQLVVSTSEGSRAAWVEDLFVLPEKRNAGIGGALLDEIHAWGEARGVRRYQLAADRGNEPALRFYQKRGWTVLNLEVLRKWK